MRNASRREIMKGCWTRLRMQTSRKTRLASSGLLRMSGILFKATYANKSSGNAEIEALCLSCIVSG